MAVRLLIVGGVLAMLAGVVVVGSASAHRQISSNYIQARDFVLVIEPESRMCQGFEQVPAGTSALRFTLGTYRKPGPPLTVRVTGDGRPSDGGLRGGWREGEVVVPLAPQHRPRTDARVCLRNDGDVPVAVAGRHFATDIGARVAGKPIGARVRVEYTTARERSWFSLLGTIAERMDNVRIAFPGGAALWVWLALLVGVVSAIAYILLRRPRRAGRLITAVALVSALAWGLVVAPFQVPDEHSHFYYAAYLAQTGDVPVASTESFWFSQKMNDVLTTQRFPQVIGVPENRPAWSDADRALIEAQQSADVDERGRGDAAAATTNSPVYYLLQAGAYALSPDTTIYGRLSWMRLLSAVFTALTVACVFGFLRELLPGRPEAAVAGSLAAALQPLFGFISSGVSNDSLMYLCSALLMYAVARAFRRGLTPGAGALIGGSLAAGVLVKTQLIAYAPGVALAVALLARQSLAARERPWRALTAGALALVAPLAVYLGLTRTVWDRPVIARVGEVTSESPELRGLVSYVWQSFLPRLPFMEDWFGGLAAKNLWADGLIGRFGWLDYGFPTWVYSLGTFALALVAAGMAATLLRERAALRRRAGEAAVYLLMLGGLLVAIASVSYLSRVRTGQQFEQARYLLPLLPLYAAAVGLAAGALGRHWSRLVGTAVVLAALAHTVFAQLLTMTRYYG